MKTAIFLIATLLSQSLLATPVPDKNEHTQEPQKIPLSGSKDDVLSPSKTVISENSTFNENSAPLTDESLYEIESHLVINGEHLEKQIFTVHMFQNEYRIFEDKNGKPYKVYYQLQRTEEGHLDLFTRVSSYVMIAEFLLNDNEPASFIAKRESPEYEVAVKVKKLPVPDTDTQKKNEADKQ